MPALLHIDGSSKQPIGGPGAKRKKGRPTARWVDDITEVAGRDWVKAATVRKDNWRRPIPERGHDIYSL